ncbi:MAG: polymer-forming cytoskeletal protein [Proteobacteria bacterium]|nr:polymer-forming cytoskeletal protein [Pseudomonadota bacterium]MBU1738698.1 polymer-forming cytoskeletal protein [Pseudomonadota bacterium]
MNNSDAITSIIGTDMTIIGDLTFNSKVRIDGNVEGNITGEYLILSESGNITGDIDADTVVCHGQIDGNLRVNKVYLKKDGVINGRLETSDLSVESGGVLNGEIKSQVTSRSVKLLQTSGAEDKKKSETPSPHPLPHTQSA